MKTRKILISLALLISVAILILEVLLPNFSLYEKDFFFDGNQKNKYFLIVEKNVDYLTPATVVALRANVDAMKIAEYLPTLCVDYMWMNPKRFIYIFATEKDAGKFDTYGYENIKRNKPVDKYIAIYNIDDVAVNFYPLVPERRHKVFLPSDWCKHTK